MDQQSRAELFRALCLRNQLRKEAGLPLISVRAEYKCAVERARRRDIYERYGAEVREELRVKMRARHGPRWGSDFGSRFMLDELVRRALAQRYGL